MHLFSTLPGELISIFRAIGNSADAVNAKAYVIGAYPRSIVVKEDCSDIEISVTGDLNSVVEHFLSSYPLIKSKSLKHEGRFVFVPSPYNEGDYIKMARARKDHHGGAGDIDSEVLCRGFSVDGLAISISSFDFGEIIDKEGAIEDIKAKVLRIMNRDLFKVEQVYIYKAIYLTARYKLSIEPMTETLLKEAIKAKYTNCLTYEQRKAELSKIKRGKNKPLAIQLLNEYNLAEEQ